VVAVDSTLHCRGNATYCVGRDITARKQTEDALIPSQKTTYNLFEAIPDVVFMMTTEGTLLACNERLAHNLGVPINELIGTNVFDSMPRLGMESVIEARKGWVKQVVVTCAAVQFQDSWRGEYYDHTISPIFNSEGEVTAVVVATHDITHLKQTEEALRKSEEQFRSVLEAAAEGILVTDSVGDIVLVNRGIEKQFGYTRDELIGAPVEILLPESLRNAHVHHRQTYREHPEVRSMGGGRELVGRRKDGSEFPVDVSLSYTRNGDLLILAFIVDITERKQIEQERSKYQRLQDEMKKERELIELRQRFMSMISHEFRTPLTAIASSSEILTHYYDRLNEETRMERVHSLNAHVHSMVNLLDDILMLNKLQAGMAELNPEVLDIAALCRRVLDTVDLIDQQQHQIVFTSDHTPAGVQADRRVLEHILTNLLSNAIKYSPPNSQVSFELSSEADRLTFIIQDQGRGIPLEDQPRLFEPFHRARNVGDVNGTGLGLAIVKSNVELHGGSIRFHSAEGEGTTFWVELPVN
jgi:PAS domain S-box-containing protein